MLNTTDPLAPDYQPVIAEPSPGWRRESPTVDEVHRWSYWWHRVSGAGEEPTIVQLDVDTVDGLPCVVIAVASGPTHRWVPLHADSMYWGGPEAEWAPAFPPGTIL